MLKLCEGDWCACSGFIFPVERLNIYSVIITGPLISLNAFGVGLDAVLEFDNAVGCDVCTEVIDCTLVCFFLHDYKTETHRTNLGIFLEGA